MTNKRKNPNHGPGAYGSPSARSAVIEEIGHLIGQQFSDRSKQLGLRIGNFMAENYMFPNIPEQIKDEQTPFHSTLRNMYNSYLVYRPLKGANYEVSTTRLHGEYFQVDCKEDVAERMRLYADDDLSKKESEHLTAVNERKMLKNVFEEFQSAHHEDGRIDFNALAIAGYVAFKNLPEASQDSKSGANKNFQLAFKFIDDCKQITLSPKEQIYIARYQELTEGGMLGQLTKAQKIVMVNSVLPALTKQQTINAAQNLWDFFINNGTNIDNISTEIELVKELQASAKHLKEIEQNLTDIDAVNTGWTILPTDSLSAPDGTVTEVPGGKIIICPERGPVIVKHGDCTPRVIDLSRIDYLITLAKEWGGYIAVREEKYVGDLLYHVAVLPDEITVDSGKRVKVEHAVADHPDAGRRAAFVWRAEQNLGKKWHQVLHQHRYKAQNEGARRMMHTIYFRDNVQEYLTRPATDLGERNYDR